MGEGDARDDVDVSDREFGRKGTEGGRVVQYIGDHVELGDSYLHLAWIDGIRILA